MSSPSPSSDLVLVLSCPDQPGIVHAVAGFLVAHGANIVQSQQFGDRQSESFFMRVQFALRSDEVDGAVPRLSAAFTDVAARFAMIWRLVDGAYRPRVLIMVSRFGHCLNDLLYRASVGALAVDVVAIVSNHTDFTRLAATYDVPFHHIPVTADTKHRAEQGLLALVADLDVDLVVLARYMQVLSDGLCARLEGRAINIHHSMLPSFKGARPYHQAHARGVKLIGATAHYVTATLDEGPIIEQEVARVTHAMSAEEVTALGRDVECQALARAVRWHAENRILLNGQRTVVLH
ncbi:MAG: formyltetrahydrofolate deformylase [Geodermatophilaceae bacterium]|nr:formyltetrahydrofolate deformylase [Geodermatophilaceae bacterium]